MNEYLGIFDVLGLECFYVKIKAEDKGTAQSKFDSYIESKGYDSEDGMIYVIPLFSDFECI